MTVGSSSIGAPEASYGAPGVQGLSDVADVVTVTIAFGRKLIIQAKFAGVLYPGGCGMFDSDESKPIRKGVLTARALVSTTSSRCPVRLNSLMPDPVQLYRKESFGELGQGLENETTEKMERIFPVTAGEKTAPLSWAATSDPRARLGRAELSGDSVDYGQEVGSSFSGSPGEPESRVLPAHLIELWDQSVAHLLPSETRSMTDLLWGFQDVFAQTDTDLGSAALVKHRMHTQNDVPSG